MASAQVVASERVAYARRAGRRGDLGRAALMLLPAMAFLLVFVYAPAAMSLALGFFHYHLFGAPSQFAGLSNFASALTYPVFWLAVRNTLLFAAMMVPTTVVGSLLIAALIASEGSLFTWVRTAVLLPYITPVIATSIGWLWMFNPQYGVLNMVLGALHIPASQWLLSPFWALPSVAMYTLWHGLGFDVVVMLGALSSVPSSVVEAARVDGASRLRALWRVVVPLVSPSLFFIAVVTTIGSLQAFSQIYALSGGQGGPEYATTTTMLLVYQTAFQYFHLSYASTMVFFLVLLILAFTGLQALVARRLVFYQ